jgi:glycerophosphoryl diester phosphodiesterase
MELGATFVEPDLVPTLDGNLVAMHTPDLNVTTNVADIFGKDRMWTSPFMNLTSWFTFNFTTDELRNLTLKQRLPQARTTLSDNVYSIPTLLDVLQLVNHWNQVDRAQWSVPVSAATGMLLDGASSSSTTGSIQHAPVGVYAELKDYAWLLQDANINMVDLLLNHMNTYADDWKQLWNSKAHPCRANHAGLVPPLVLQSFDVSVLEHFHDQWHSNMMYVVVGCDRRVVYLAGKCWREAEGSERER